MFKGKLINASMDAKTIKGEKQGFVTAIMYLAPHTIATKASLCPHSTAACRAACLYTAGRGAMSNVQNARIGKAKWFESDQAGFMRALVLDVERFLKYAAKKDFVPVIRLNGTSDIMWERIPVTVGGKDFPSIMAAFNHIRFYDYTKIPPRYRAKYLPANYDLTFSQSENNESEVLRALSTGFRVATVFRKTLPTEWLNREVVVGDDSDLRFLDARGVIVGLTAKGAAKKDSSGFVHDIA